MTDRTRVPGSIPGRDQAFDEVPYLATPPLTAEPVLHLVVECEGVPETWRNMRDGYPQVYGRTKCGKSQLLLDRRDRSARGCLVCFPHGDISAAFYCARVPAADGGDR